MLTLLALVITLGFSAKADYTCLFGPTYNSGGISAYDKTWTVTVDGFEWKLANFNNNNNDAKWNYVKCGRKNIASTGTITTSNAIPEKVVEIELTIGEIASPDNLTSVTLYTSTTDDFTNPIESIDVEKKVDKQIIKLQSPAENLYYQLSFVCTGAKKNGVVQVNKILYVVASDKPTAPTFNPNGGEVDVNSVITITGDDKTQSLKYWFDDEEATTVTGATATVTITKACTLNAVAIGEGGVESSTNSISFTLTPVMCDYTKVTTLTSGKYVFMCGDNFVDPVLSSNRCDFTTDFTKTGDEVEALNKYEFTITVDANNVATIQGTDGMYYGMPKANTVFASFANADNSCNWTYTVNADGQVIFTNSEYPTYTIAQHMGTQKPYNNMAPGIYKEGAVYPTLYKLVVAPAAPELDGVEITAGTITGDKLAFKVVEGVSVWYKIETETVANAPAREVNAEGYTKYEGEPITLTNNMKSVTYYSEDNATGAKSEPVTYAIDFLSGITDIEAEAGEAVYYNLQGVRVENPAKGLYIRVANGKSQKVIM